MALVGTTRAAVVINEILYRPGTAATYPEDTGKEWIELRNTGGASVDIGGWKFDKGINFTFVNGTTIPANGYLVVVANTAKFTAAFPGITNVGPWTGSLSNSSETLRLVDALNVTMDEVTYASEGDWAQRVREATFGGWAWSTAADNGGKSIELRNPVLAHTNGQNWGVSTNAVGSPGAANTVATTNVAPLISGMTHSPAIPKSTEAVTISCQVADETPAASLTVNLFWRDATTASPPAFASVPMTNVAGTFSATLPAKVNLTIVEFYVSASDGTNTRTWPAPTNEGQNANCQYQVDDEVLNATDHYYRLVLTAAENAAFVAVASSSDRQFNQTLVVARGAERIIRYSASMRIRGNSSRDYTFRPLRISIPNDNPWEGIDAFNCNPKSPYLQYIGMSIFAAAGVPASTAAPIELRRNGVESTTSSGGAADFGKWVRVEEINGDMVDNHWPDANSGNLYSKRRPDTFWKSGDGAPTNPDTVLNGWSKQSNSSANDWTDLTSFFTAWQAAAAPHFPGATNDVNAHTWNGTPLTAPEITSIETVADLDQWAKWFAIIAILEDNETNISNGQDDDYDVYFHPAANGQRRLQFIPHDMDNILGQGEGPLAFNAVGLYDVTDNGSIFKPLLPLFGNDSTVGNEAFRTKYHLALQDVYGTVLNADTTGNPTPAFYTFLDSLNLTSNWVPPATVTAMKTFATQRQAHLLGLINSPFWSKRGGTVAAGSTFTLSLRPGKSGIIKYTTDGSDPKTSGTAITYSGAITISSSVTINVRILDGATWGALDRATFYVTQDFSKLAVTEINYNPPALGAVSGDELEFLEIKNTGNVSIDLGGLNFTTGITYTFPNNTFLAPGGFFILVRDVTAGQTNFHTRYPGVTVNGIYTGKLDNGGETLTLTAPTGANVFALTYDDTLPWPLAADGNGATAVPKTTIYNSDNGVNWRASANIFGSPNADDPVVTTNVVINEILTNSGAGFLDTIELHNPTNASVNVGDWYLTDDPNIPKKYRIPANTIIPVGGYAFFDETHFNPASPPPGNTSFALNSAGDDVYLFSGDAGGNLTGYIHGFAFAGAELNVSFGRILTSAGDEYFPRQISRTFGSANSGPLVGPLVINEIMYHPIASYDEFIEIRNISVAAVPLYDPANPANTWKLTGIGYTFPTAQSIPGGGYALVVAMDPAAFRTKYNVPMSVQIFGPYTGSLQDNGERLSLEMPDAPVLNGLGQTVIPYDIIDTVRYSNLAPWPTLAGGTGPSLQRSNSGTFGDDPANWFADGITGGFPNAINQPSTIAITAPAHNSPYTTPATVTFTASGSDPDGSIIKVEYFSGINKLGESTTGPNYTFAWASTPGTHTITAKSTDNSLGTTTSAPITIYVTNLETQGLKGEYYPNKTLTAPIVGTRTDAFAINNAIDFKTTSNPVWPTAYGFPGLTTTNFSVRWSGQIRATATGNYTFRTSANDGVRLTVNGSLIINSWVDTSTGTTAQVETATAVGTIANPGNATVIVSGAGITGTPVTLSVAVLAGDTAAQWAEKVKTAINANAAINALYTATRTNADIFLTRNTIANHDAILNISLNNGTCTGITPAPTSATTTAGTGDPTNTTSTPIALTAGQLYDIVLEFYQNTGIGSVNLKWTPPGSFQDNVFQTFLYPDSIPIIINHPAGVAQTETLTVTASAGATGDGNLTVTVTSAFFATTAVTVPLLQATHTTATKIAEAIVTALNANPAIGSKFTASNTGASIILTTKTENITSNDSTLNVAITAALGVTGVATSTNGVAGVAPTLSKDQGTSHTFTVLASGHNLTYQWRKNGAFIPGATSQNYTIPYLTPSDAAQYSVFVSNSYGFAVSANAQLTVTFTDTDGDGIQNYWETAYGLNPNSNADAALDLDGDGMTNLQEFLAGTIPNDPNSKFAVTITKSVSPPGCTLTFTAQPYKSYTLQYKDSITAPSWTTLQTYPATTTQQTVNYTDSATGYDARFYRVSTP